MRGRLRGRTRCVSRMRLRRPPSSSSSSARSRKAGVEGSNPSVGSLNTGAFAPRLATAGPDPAHLRRLHRERPLVLAYRLDAGETLRCRDVRCSFVVQLEPRQSVLRVAGGAHGTRRRLATGQRSVLVAVYELDGDRDGAPGVPGVEAVRIRVDLLAQAPAGGEPQPRRRLWPALERGS